MVTTPNYDPTHKFHWDIARALVHDGFQEGEEAFRAGRMIAYAAGDAPSAMPIEWHEEVIESGFRPNADNFRAMQTASFVAKTFIRGLL